MLNSGKWCFMTVNDNWQSLIIVNDSSWQLILNMAVTPSWKLGMEPRESVWPSLWRLKMLLPELSVAILGSSLPENLRSCEGAGYRSDEWKWIKMAKMQKDAVMCTKLSTSGGWLSNLQAWHAQWPVRYIQAMAGSWHTSSRPAMAVGNPSNSNSYWDPFDCHC